MKILQFELWGCQIKRELLCPIWFWFHLGLDNNVNLEILEIGDNKIKVIQNLSHLTKVIYTYLRFYADKPIHKQTKTIAELWRKICR